MVQVGSTTIITALTSMLAICIVNKSVAGFDKNWLPHTQQQDTLFTITITKAVHMN